ncbi:MAG: hypothetical protein ACLUDU_18145, partial [Butyricimonas faecihominis]
APPVIMSVFLGNYLSGMLDELVEKVSDRKMSPDEKTELKLNVGKIPEIMLDNTDRNRTSPFAFTGNRFEFRAVGSSANCGGPMIALNAAVAEQLIAFKNGCFNRRVKKTRQFSRYCVNTSSNRNPYVSRGMVTARNGGKRPPVGDCPRRWIVSRL